MSFIATFLKLSNGRITSDRQDKQCIESLVSSSEYMLGGQRESDDGFRGDNIFGNGRRVQFVSRRESSRRTMLWIVVCTTDSEA